MIIMIAMYIYIYIDIFGTDPRQPFFAAGSSSGDHGHQFLKSHGAALSVSAQRG